MYLKSLELHGFKSFAQKTVLEFIKNNNGRYSTTAIVGPNGAGKSNIVDAIRWVMGEQSMKTLRGKRGEDIIFSGSEVKGKMGMAAVTMTLENGDHKLPVDFDELVITRRYYRSGDSEYLINGKTVRLLDLQLLLAKAQFGQGSYGVIGQGTIDRLLLQTPQERKDFFDEACGIKEFQIKRHQAILKLHRTQENIEQATLLFNEIDPRLRSLSRQVKKLEKRQDIEILLRELQEQYYLTLYQHNKIQWDELQEELIKIDQEYNSASEELNSVQTELSKLAREESRQELFAKLQSEYQQKAREKSLLERELAVLEGKLQTEYSQVGKQNVGWLNKKISELHTDKTRLDLELQEVETMVDKLSGQILTNKQQVENFMLERTEARSRLVNLEQRLVQSKNEQSLWQYTGLKAVQAILEARASLGAVFGTVAQLGEVEDKYRLALDVAGGGHLSSLIVDTDNTAQKGIEYLRQQQLGVATFLPLNKIKPRFVAQDIQELKNKKGVHGLAVELVKFEAKFADIFSYVLGNTLIIDNLDVARAIGIGRVRMVTLDGDVVEISGSMKGGYRKKDQNKGLSFAHTEAGYSSSTDLSSQESALLAEQKKLNEAEIAYEKAQENLREIQSQTQITTSQADVLGRQKQALERELATLSQELSVYAMSPDEYSQSLNLLAEEKEVLNKKIQICESDLTSAEKKIADFNQAEENKKQRIFELQEIMQTKQEILNQVVDERNQKRVLVAKLETKQEDLASEIYQELRTAVSALLERGLEVIALDKLEGQQQEIQKMKYQLSLIGGIDEEVVSEYQETKERYDFLEIQLADLNKAMKDLEGLVSELDEMMKKKRDRVFRQIKKEFARFFALLFDGGKAELVEVYGQAKDEGVDSLDLEKGYSENQEELENNKETIVEKKNKPEVLLGIDVFVSPPGKKINSLQALSGGERTLTSLALLSAILYINPSPFVVLDEVEAALDEVNTERFNRILQELSTQSQFIIITHNRVTMHAMNALYGVTMGGDGISHLLSVNLGEAEKITE